MFDNVISQNVVKFLIDDILKDKFPGAVLFSGPEASGKLTCALETARVLSCEGVERGHWECTCPSCVKHRQMVSNNILLLGPKNKSLEIFAAKKTLLTQSYQNSKHLEASRHLYIRAIRKLLARYNPVLHEGNDNYSKVLSTIQSINETLELIDFSKTLPEGKELENILNELDNLCEKLENSSVSDTITISQVRNLSSWAHFTNSSEKKIIILENVETMIEASRNALLKILEEPPKNTIFILTSSRRGAILPTILSRVRTYNFIERNQLAQKEVLERVFHVYNTEEINTVKDYLFSFLPISLQSIKQQSQLFFDTIAKGQVPDSTKIVEQCGGFKPKLLFKIFLEGIIDSQKYLLKSAAGVESSSKILFELNRIYSDVNVFNQNPLAALEELTRLIMQINYINKGILIK